LRLDQVDVARRNAEPLGDLGLRQPELLADAPEAGSDEQLFPESLAMAASLSLSFRGATKVATQESVTTIVNMDSGPGRRTILE